ncbi:dienelactone hydrolase family protein [Miltoncostaea marina]|uniref:dienelactone hydrolase family protein n=1 Tax=Miltoncostaea marina TaxID=2843215 RepID=UPI0031BA9BEE
MDGPAERAVRIPTAAEHVDADLVVPDGARGVVVFAHGSGSSRRSGRNRRVAATLQAAGLATLLLDLLTPAEERVDVGTREHRFDIALLARRLVDAIDWLPSQAATARLPVGLFGASTGAAAALVAAAARPLAVGAVVSRGGRPDLAGAALERVVAPVLLIVGGDDRQVIPLNESALDRLGAESQMRLVHGATHLFQEPGALERVGELARDWFLRRLPGAAQERPPA